MYVSMKVSDYTYVHLLSTTLLVKFSIAFERNFRKEGVRVPDDF